MPRLGAERALVVALALAGCAKTADPSPARTEPPVHGESSTRVSRAALGSAPVLLGASSASASASVLAAPAVLAPPLPERYPWLRDASLRVPAVAGPLDERIAPPDGFARVPLVADTFGAWLRRLPLAPEGTPVTSFRGGVILPPDHENLAAVVAIDIGNGDLQQCADSVIRLHAEWLWSRGRRDQSYRAASGTPLPFTRWAAGERVVNEGDRLRWAPSRQADASHAAFRGWLDAVFAWANTGALARDTRAVALADLRPGDFVVQPGGPGHAVLVLDLATSADGRRAVLLGQGFMPAQSFQVLRPARRSAWFIVEERGLTTPFWPTFAWSTLHRFDGT